jgi:DNA repair exonuclease SbcCD ATPase subunit
MPNAAADANAVSDIEHASQERAEHHHRDTLLQALAALSEEQQRLSSLEAARERARESSWAASRKINEAETALRQARAEEPTRLAYEFASGGMNAVSSISSAQLALEAAQAEASQIERIEGALDSELIQVTNRLQRAQAAVHRALADLVCSSTEYQSLLEQHTAAWQRLRTIKVALRTIQTALRGEYPQRLAELIALSEPLEERVGYPVDAAFVGAWADALAQLEQDADAELPLFG